MLTPAPGCVLTQADASIDIADRVFATKIYTGPASSSQWADITIEEAEEQKELQNQVVEERRKEQERQERKQELESQLAALNQE